ncbi:MAG: glycoside hydrolase family 125 protein [Candidatus Limnocylindria bacterium]
MTTPPHDARAKPVDLGNGVIAASLGSTNAALLSLIAVHPEHGVVELSGLPPFDEADRGDPAATRRHRSLMLDDSLACCWLETDAGERLTVDAFDLTDPQAPTWHGRLGPIEVAATAGAREGAAAVEVTWHLAASGAQPILRLRFSGRLDRPALAEITEIDPPAPTGALTELSAAGALLRVVAGVLPASATLEASLGAWRAHDGGATLEVPWPPGATSLQVTLRCRLDGPGTASAGGRAMSASTGPGFLVDRALAYVRGCTALAVAPGERVILTDHRLLPLSWTRDAYYQALLLLATGDGEDIERVADHLRWLWRRCERPDGRWVRSHHANGRRKDMAFQADQQLYPLVELADFWRATGSLPGGMAWTDVARGAWSAALAEVDPASGLMASTENAADDPATAPFIGASQILLWYASLRLADLARAGALDLDVQALVEVAARTHAAFDRYLATESGWSYATDAHGARTTYHDANDLPVALAPLWGFCDADDVGWLRTMAFALSADNPGFFPGPRGGLGSVHTPGAWSLGDVQAWIAASVRGDASGAADALRRLEDVAFHDGMLPEAYSPTPEPDLRIRHWFAWPGAALGALLLMQHSGTLATRLRARY